MEAVAGAINFITRDDMFQVFITFLNMLHCTFFPFYLGGVGLGVGVGEGIVTSMENCTFRIYPSSHLDSI